MDLPTGKKIYEGEIATSWMDNGILVSVSKSPQRTVENIKGNMALVREITGNKKVPLLIFLSKSPVPDKETRKFASAQLPNLYTAMAMVSKPGLAKLIMNMLFSFRPQPIPMKTFSNEKEAREWLKAFL